MHDDPVRWPVLLVALSACGRIGFDPGGLATGDDVAGGDGGLGTGDGALTDGATSDGTSGTCIDPGNGCTFPGGLPCSCFGSPMMINAGLSEGSSGLRITPNANTIGAQGSCVRTQTPFGAGGAVLVVTQVVSGAQGLTAFQLGGGADVFTLSHRNGQLIAEDGGGTVNTIVYLAALMHWWRMRPSAPGVSYEFSADGVSWTPFAVSTRAPSSSYTVRIIGGTVGAVAAPGFAQIDSVNLCAF